MLSVIVAQGLAATLAAGAAFSLVRAVRLPSPRIATTAMRELLVGGAPIVALNAAILAQPYLDAIVLSKLAPPAVMGWHAAAKTFMAAFVTPAAILASAAYPRLSRAASDRAAFGHELEKAIRPLVWVAAGATSATYLLADVAIAAVYGRAGYAPAVTALEWFAPALLLFFVDILLGHACVAIGKARAFALAKVGAVIISTALDVALVPWFQARAGNGVLGVVVSLILSELVMITAATVLLPRGTLHRGIVSDIGRAVLAAAGGPILLMALPPTGVVVRGAIGAIAFMALSAAVGLVTLKDIRVLRDSFRRRTAGAQTG